MKEDITTEEITNELEDLLEYIAWVHNEKEDVVEYIHNSYGSYYIAK